MRAQQIIKHRVGFKGKMKDLPAFLASLKTIVPITFRNI